MTIFSDLPLLPAIKQALATLGFTTPTEIQAKVIPFLLENPTRDIHAQAQTGTGKTLAFGIPLLHAIDPSVRAVQALIIAPTRELVMQTYESLRDISGNTGVICEPIYGGMPINKQITNIRRGAHIIIGTPGRLNDHLRRKTLQLDRLKILVLDEADIMLDMGFRDEVDNIMQRIPGQRTIWLFSATVMPGIKQLINSHMSNVHVVKAASEKGVVSSQVKQYYCMVAPRKRTEVAARFIEAEPDFYGIIFCQTKVLASEVAEKLVSKGFRANCLHGDMSQSLRNQVIKGFKNKDFSILVATDVAARGIDVSGLTHVINFSIPDEHESYIHRIGRTGRAGKEGKAIVFVAPSEAYRIRRLEKLAHTHVEEIEVPPLSMIINKKMSAVSDFIEQAKKPVQTLSPVHTVIQELIKSFAPDEVSNALAIALEDKFFKDMVHDDLGNVKSSGGMPGGAAPQEICIDLGRSAGLSEDMVRDYVIQTCNVLASDVTKVHMLDHKTFISVPEHRLRDCVQSMKAAPISQQAHRVFIVEDVYRDRQDRPRRQHRGNFGRGRRGGDRRSMHRGRRFH